MYSMHILLLSIPPPPSLRHPHSHPHPVDKCDRAAVLVSSSPHLLMGISMSASSREFLSYNITPSPELSATECEEASRQQRCSQHTDNDTYDEVGVAALLPASICP
eukprot:TRINITY_DN3722_c0_g1_i5.p2 TRINITY_DN3722_c0_g1~~TRINITY_DN3722_c0_g1_i5.p2  ORF type:complete len:106 (-),score=16.54 TRINITY_DN3722_c0_g1_i5:243-560(-)